MLLVVTLALPLLAQDSGGQLWVQAFEDRNGNGQHDAGEPFLTQGVSVDLLNADGVIVASATLDGAPYASSRLYRLPLSRSGHLHRRDHQPGTDTDHARPRRRDHHRRTRCRSRCFTARSARRSRR